MHMVKKRNPVTFCTLCKSAASSTVVNYKIPYPFSCSCMEYNGKSLAVALIMVARHFV